jgi:membrane-associated phospholipid phosphatase
MSRRTKLALSGAAAGLGLLALTWLLALHVGTFERADQAIFAGFVDLHYRHRIDRVAQVVAHLCDPSPYVYLAAVPVLVALLRRRRRSALAIGAILLGANLTTQVLKPLLAAPRAGWLLHGLVPVPPGSWPSGHATAAMSLALCCVLAAPPRLRPAAATLGAAFAVAVSYSFLALGWHFPSDVFGGFLVAGTWTMLALAALSTADERWPHRWARRPVRISVGQVLAPQVLVVAGVAALGGLLALARPHAVLSYARAHEVFLLGAGAIGALALVVAGAITLIVRR